MFHSFKFMVWFVRLTVINNHGKDNGVLQLYNAIHRGVVFFRKWTMETNLSMSYLRTCKAVNNHRLTEKWNTWSAISGWSHLECDCPWFFGSVSPNKIYHQYSEAPHGIQSVHFPIDRHGIYASFASPSLCTSRGPPLFCSFLGHKQGSCFCKV